MASLHTIRIAWNILVFELYVQKLSTNHIAWFFKFEYLLNRSTVFDNFLHVDIKPSKEYGESTLDGWFAPGVPYLPKIAQSNLQHYDPSRDGAKWLKYATYHAKSYNTTSVTEKLWLSSCWRQKSSVNQIALFFKFEYLVNRLTVFDIFWYGDKKP